MLYKSSSQPGDRKCIRIWASVLIIVVVAKKALEYWERETDTEKLNT